MSSNTNLFQEVIKSFVKDYEIPLLDEFIKKYWNLIALEEEFNDANQIKSVWIRRFFDVVRAEKPHLKQKEVCNVDDDVWEKFVIKRNLQSDDIRNVLFQWFFFLEENSTGLLQFLEKNEALINNCLNNISTTGDLLNKLSVDMLRKYPEKKHLTKLFLSWIIDGITNKIKQAYEEGIPDIIKLNDIIAVSQNPVENSYLPASERNLISIVLGQVIEVMKDSGIKACRIYIIQEQATLLEDDEDNEDRLEFKVFDICLHVCKNMERWKREDMNKAPTEAEIVHRVKSILEFIFVEKELKNTIGETAAVSTKPTIKRNEEQFSGGSHSSFNVSSLPSRTTSSSATNNYAAKNVIGRKIDMMFTGTKNLELAFCEFKAENIEEVMEHQESKNLRLNQCAFERLRRVGLEDHNIMALNWGRMTGVMFKLLAPNDEGAMVARPFQKLILPSTPEEFVDDRFKETILSFYEWKHHMLNLNNQAVEKLFNNSSSNNNSAEPAPCLPRTMLSPRPSKRKIASVAAGTSEHDQESSRRRTESGAIVSSNTRS